VSGGKAGSATEAAQLMATMMADTTAWPEEAARDLARLLGHGLGAPDSATLRHARLGLLVALVGSGEGLFVEAQAYDQVRAARLALGEEWPTASALSRAYGHWLVAVRAAMRFWFEGGAARVAADHSHARRERPYTPEEVVSALSRCREQLQVASVSEWEYDQWRRLCRKRARRAGQAMPRLPSLPVVRRHFGDFTSAERLRV
jgi:hypothetical protein